jgi:hypothetical protein
MAIEKIILKESLLGGDKVTYKKGALLTPPFPEEISDMLKQKSLRFKYFTIFDPEAVQQAPQAPQPYPKEFICDVCGKPCKNDFGLMAHKRSHGAPENESEMTDVA